MNKLCSTSYIAYNRCWQVPSIKEWKHTSPKEHPLVNSQEEREVKSMKKKQEWKEDDEI
jgi:hypothetical protein